jgi:hypothetical protein
MPWNDGQGGGRCLSSSLEGVPHLQENTPPTDPTVGFMPRVLEGPRGV